MTKTVLILGPTGRFGRNAAEAFEAAGWRVRRFDRKRDDLESAARGVSVIVNAWNPPYGKWARDVLAIQPGVHKVALANDATVIIPGNVYVFGEETPSPWSDTSHYGASNPMGRIRIDMERGYRDAGVRTIILRAGDYIDTQPSGNWFDRIMVPSLAKGKFTYPGRTDIERAWGYLPDVARATVMLAEKRDVLAHFEDVCFPGYTLSARQIAETLAQMRGHEVTIKPVPWGLFRLIRPFMADMKGILEMRYLWNKPHRLDGEKFDRLLPGFLHTPVQEALMHATAHLEPPQERGVRVQAA